MRYLFKNVPLGVVLMIAILILLFGDYRKPAVILCCIPLLGIGVVGAMAAYGQGLHLLLPLSVHWGSWA